MFTSRVVRSVVSVQKRNMSFVTKNTVKETRAKFFSNPAVGAENPTYMKGSNDSVTAFLGMAGVVGGTVTILVGLVNMTLGINKVQ